MASCIIHLAIAKKVREKINIENEKDYYLGSIAPDIARQIGMSRNKSHFIINSVNEEPNIKIFTKRYPTFKYNSFNLGYYTHLFADKEWLDFMANITYGDSIRLLDGTIIKMDKEEIDKLIYSDYSDLNIKVVEEYDLDLSLFYEEFKIPNTPIQEIPIEKLDILINKMGIIMENSKSEKTYTFDIYLIKEFIDKTAEKIIEELEKY